MPGAEDFMSMIQQKKNEVTGKLAGTFQAGVGLYQLLKSNQQRKKAMKQLAANPYTVPSGVTSAVNMAGTQAQGYGLAGQDVIEENIASNTGATVGAAKRAATTPSQVLASTVAAYQAKQQQQQQLYLAAAQDYRTRQQGYQNALLALAPYQEKIWEYNTLFPVQSRINRAAQLQGAGTQNMATGISGIINVGANASYLNSLNDQPAQQAPLVSNVPPVQQTYSQPTQNPPLMYPQWNYNRGLGGSQFGV